MSQIGNIIKVKKWQASIYGEETYGKRTNKLRRGGINKENWVEIESYERVLGEKEKN